MIWTNNLGGKMDLVITYYETLVEVISRTYSVIMYVGQ